MLIYIKDIARVAPLHICWGGSGSRPLMPPPFLSPKYYMSARHKALAKAFPEHFTYEPQETDAVSGLGTTGLGWGDGFPSRNWKASGALDTWVGLGTTSHFTVCAYPPIHRPRATATPGRPRCHHRLHYLDTRALL